MQPEPSTPRLFKRDLIEKCTTTMGEGVEAAPAEPLRFLMSVGHVLTGDIIKVPVDAKDAPTGCYWHTVTVLNVTSSRDTISLTVDAWPIDYVCAHGTLVEAVEIKRTARFHCSYCHPSGPDKKVTVTLDDFRISPSLQEASGLAAIIIEPIRHATEGYCALHLQDVLHPR